MPSYQSFFHCNKKYIYTVPVLDDNESILKHQNMTILY